MVKLQTPVNVAVLPDTFLNPQDKEVAVSGFGESGLYFPPCCATFNPFPVALIITRLLLFNETPTGRFDVVARLSFAVLFAIEAL